MNSREKGAAAERELARALRALGYEARRGQQYQGSPWSPDVTGLPGIHIECKRQEQIRIYDWMAQSISDSAEDEIPTVIFRKNRTKWMVCLSLEDFITIYREWEAGRDGRDNLSDQ